MGVKNGRLKTLTCYILGTGLHQVRLWPPCLSRLSIGQCLVTKKFLSLMKIG